MTDLGGDDRAAPARVGMKRREVIVGATALLAGSRPVFAEPVHSSSRMEVVAKDLAFPEGLFTMPDGRLGCVEIADANLVRISARSGVPGASMRRTPLGGGPNGAAVGPDGAIYIANNGGLSFDKVDGRYSITGVPADYVSGSVQRVDVGTGRVTTLYNRRNDQILHAPNDLVFADEQGFWFTDTGKFRNGVQDKGALYWAAIDGSEIRRVLHPLEAPNGIALSPDRKTLYMALSMRREIASLAITGTGQADPTSLRTLCTLPGKLILDNIAVEQSGNLVVATVIEGGLMTVSPAGAILGFMPLPDIAVTAVAFGGRGHRTLFAALSASGRIVATPWPRPGMPALFAGRIA